MKLEDIGLETKMKEIKIELGQHNNIFFNVVQYRNQPGKWYILHDDKYAFARSYSEAVEKRKAYLARCEKCCRGWWEDHIRTVKATSVKIAGIGKPSKHLQRVWTDWES